MDFCDFNGFVYRGNIIWDLYWYVFKKGLYLLRYTGTILKVHFLYILGKKDKSRLALVVFDCLLSCGPREQVIRDFLSQEKIQNKLDTVPPGAVILSFLPKDFVQAACPGHRVIALEPDMMSFNLKSELLFAVLGSDVTVRKYYFGNSIDNSIIPLSQSVITRGGMEYDHSKKSFKRMFFVREFLMYAMVGGINTLCGVLSAYFFSYLFHPLIAFLVGYALFLILSYYLNSKLTFKAKHLSLIGFLRFCVAYIPSFVIQFLLAGTLLNVFGEAKFIVYVLTVIAGIPLTFLVMRFYSFAKKNIADESGKNKKTKKS